MQYFIVNSNDIGNKRIDPYYYNLEFTDFEKRLIKSKYQKFKFGDLIDKVVNGLDFRKFSEYGKIYIKVGNISKNGLNINNAQKIDINPVVKDIKLNKGSLLLTRKGTFGVAYALKEDLDYIISSEVFKITINNELTNAQFLEIILNSDIGQKQFDKVKIGAIMGSLSQEAIKEISIPLPPIKTQEQIIAIMEKAHASKKIMEAEATELLSGIDDYVLSELGIELPKIEQKKCFAVMSDDIKGERLDPAYSIEKNSSYNSVKFESKTINQLLSQGFIVAKKGESITKKSIADGNIPVIAGGQSVPYYHDQSNFFNAITISSSGAYAGYVWYHNYHFWASDCTVVYSANEKLLLTEYLYCFLKSQQKAIYKRQRGAGQPHVYLQDLEDFKISLPSIEIQNKIAQEVKARTNKAEKLKEEAKSILQKAKDEVEKMILGE